MTNPFNSWLNQHSLRFKLNLSILSCVFLGFLGLFFVISQKAEPIIKDQINAIAQKTVELYVADFSHVVSETERVVLSAKNMLSQMTADNTEALKVVLNSAIKTINHSDLTFINSWLYVFSPENVSSGQLYASRASDNDTSTDFFSESVPNLYDRFPWFKEVPKEEKIYWSEPYFDAQTKKPVVTCLIPFKFMFQTEFNGLVALTVDLSAVQESVNNFSFYETGKILLLSRSGLYVAHSDPDIALKMTIFELARKMRLPELASAGEKMLKGQEGEVSIPFSSVVDGPAIFYFAPIKNIGWSICLVYSQKELLKPIRQFQLIIIVSFFICILVLLLIINRISHNSTNQLIELGNIAAQYGKGDFNNQFSDMPMSSDISRLAGALANMRTNLLDYINKERKEASEKQKNQSELDIAKNIQKSALSTSYPQNEAFKIATMMIPAQKVGGDFYDFFFIDDNKFAVLVADVSGKGIPASLYMMKALTLLRHISKSSKSLDFVFSQVNQQLYDGNDTCMFVTVFMAVIDLTTGQVRFINAGHTPPLIANNNKTDFLKMKTNIALGINPNAQFVEESLLLEPDTHLFLYTDGVTEAENSKKEFYGEKRLLSTYKKAKNSPQENLNLVLESIKKFAKTHSQSDDITMLDFAFYGFKSGVMTFSADVEKLNNVLDFLKKDMAAHKLSDKSQFNMTMVVEEIFSNIALYAYNTKENAFVNIKTDVKDDIYSVTFIDKGKEYNPLEMPAPDVSTDLKNKNIGGLGVYLAKTLSDTQSYSYTDQQNILTIGIHINK